MSDDTRSAGSPVQQATEPSPSQEEHHTSAAQNATHPIHRLPAELLVEVFLWQLLFFTQDYETKTKDPMVTFDRVSPLVCRFWRAVAHGDPRLWTHVVAPPLAALETFTQRYLPRSGDLPLDLEFHGPLKGLAPFIAAMSPYAARWGSLDLRGTCESFRQMMPVETPVLRRVQIYVDWDGWDGQSGVQHLMLHVLHEAPRIHTLKLACRNHGPQTLELTIPPLPHLASFELWASECDLTSMLRTLRGSYATLCDIRLYIEDFLPPTDPLECPAYLPSLKSLALSGNAGRFLQLISPPALETLKMTNEPEDLLDLLRRVPATGRSLQNLDLQSLGDCNILDCLALAPNLKVLRLGVCRAPGPLLRGLTIYEDDPAEHPILVPKLELLSLDHCVDSEDLLAVDEFFISRAFPQVVRETQVEGVRMAVSRGLMQRIRPFRHHSMFIGFKVLESSDSSDDEGSDSESEL